MDRREHWRKNFVAVLEHIDRVALDHLLSGRTVQRPEKCVELGRNPRHAHHPVLVIRFGVRGESDVEKSRRKRADDSSD